MVRKFQTLLPTDEISWDVKTPRRIAARSSSVSKNFDTLLKNASIFSRGCRPLRALAFARTLVAWEVCFPTYTPPENTI